MPLVRIEIIKGKSADYKKQILDIVHDSLVKAIQIEEWDRFQRLIEIDDEFFERSEGKTDKFAMIEITMFPGRTKEQKEKIFEEITTSLKKKLGIPETDVFIVLYEPPNENWGLAGKQRGYSKELTIKVENEQTVDKQILLENLDKLHTTEMGEGRIKKNLKTDAEDVVTYCKNLVLDEKSKIYRQGKNWYCETGNIVITINAYSYTIITAHEVKGKK